MKRTLYAILLSTLAALALPAWGDTLIFGARTK